MDQDLEKTDSRLTDDRLITLRYLLPFFGCAAAVFVGWFLVNAMPNVITAMALLCAALLFSCCLVNPSLGCYLLIATSGYFDLVKRLGVLTDSLSELDVFVILAIAPIMSACLLAGTIYQLTIRRRALDRQQKAIFIFVLLIVAASYIQAFLRPSGQSSTLQEFASEGAYVPLAFLVTVLFPAPGQVRRLLTFTVVIYAPVAAYGIWQQYFGLSSFEINYLKSGLTSTLGLLDDIRIRPFSSLNSPHAFGVTTAMLACLAAFFPLGDKRQRLWQYPIALLLFFGCLASVVRAAWFLVVLACIGFLCFRSRALTLILYILAVTTFTGILFNTQFVSNTLEKFDQYLPDDDDLESQAFRLGTFGARLDSFQNVLTNPNFHTLFGKSGAEIDELQGDLSNLAHEQIGQILIRSGFVGLTLFLGILAAGLIYAHVTVFKQTDPFRRDALVACLSVVFGTVGSGLLFGSSLGVFPVNILFAVTVGVFFTLSNPERAEVKTGAKPEPGPSRESGRLQASSSA